MDYDDFSENHLSKEKNKNLLSLKEKNLSRVNYENPKSETTFDKNKVNHVNGINKNKTLTSKFPKGHPVNILQTTKIIYNNSQKKLENKLDNKNKDFVKDINFNSGLKSLIKLSKRIKFDEIKYEENFKSYYIYLRKKFYRYDFSFMINKDLAYFVCCDPFCCGRGQYILKNKLFNLSFPHSINYESHCYLNHPTDLDEESKSYLIKHNKKEMLLLKNDQEKDSSKFILSWAK